MGVEDAVIETREGTIIRVEVTSASKKVGFGYNQWRKAVEVKVKSPAQSGKANRELLKLMSNLFGQAEILSGEKSRLKTIKVDAKRSEVVEKLEMLIPKF